MPAQPKRKSSDRKLTTSKKMAPAYSAAALACVSFATFAAAVYVAGDGHEALLPCGGLLFSLIFGLYAAERVLQSAQFGIVARAGVCGVIFGLGLQVGINYGERNPVIGPLGIWLILLSLFHFGEYISVALFCSQSLSLDSFLLNHSWSYHAAAVVAMVEYAVECWSVPQIKMHPVAQIVSLVGIGISLAGDLMRKTALYQAGNSFNHLVQHQRRPGHALITAGVYGHCRHPSYFGWAMFALGTQVVLLNPLCFMLYMPAIYQFFSRRIRNEEKSLLNMFGDEYAEYMNEVPFSGIPGCGLSLPEVDGILGQTRTKKSTALHTRRLPIAEENLSEQDDEDENDMAEQIPPNSE